jgi:hypothetical protein
VDFFEPLKPALPALDHTTALPALSVIVMSVLLNVALMCATPSASTARLRAFGRGRGGTGLGRGAAAGGCCRGLGHSVLS